MASSPQPRYRDEEFDTTNANLPGYTVDALLADGKVDEARKELERLLQKGIDSGLSPESPADMMERLRARVRARAASH